MAVAPQKQLSFNLTALPLNTKKTLNFLSEQIWLKNSSWYLAGGTALALCAGHRKSVDLDFFSIQKEFDNEELLGNFISNKEWLTSINKKNTVYGALFKTKISFIAYPFFIPKQKFLRYGTIKILQPLDIAVMKIIAISQRGRKRDFFDLYWCAKNLEPLDKTVRRLKVQYPTVAHDYHHILKSLVYFEDAENDPDPEIFFKATWRGVKQFFTKEVPRITAEIIHLN